ncbi:MAG: hypothetical protein JXA01_02575 [Dehalococcoidia bacterium]|nr:hypothetical protein [Dehalococcoidia bacterium]
MTVKFSEKELSLLTVLLIKEAAELKVEVHHTRNHEYREILKEREKQIAEMLNRLKDREPAPLRIYV